MKTIGSGEYNSLWIERCFGEAELQPLKDKPVVCSGSTMGSYIAIQNYIRLMLQWMDKIQCWRKGL